MKTNTETTRKPTGLGISRDKNVFTLSWKKGDSNYSDGQQLQYRLRIAGKWRKWHTISVAHNVTKKTVTLALSNYYPTKGKSRVTGIQFRVRGKRTARTTREKYYDKKDKKYKYRDLRIKYKYSAWSYYKFTIKVPNAPSLSVSFDESVGNRATFSWKVKASDKAHPWFRWIKLQTCLVKDGAKPKKWKDLEDGIYTNPTGSRSIPEDSATLADGNSWTRWVRGIAYGPGGHNKKFGRAKHTYASPNAPQITKAKITETTAGTTAVEMYWKTSTSSGTRPVKETVAEWVIETPEEGMTCPEGASFDPVPGPVRDTSGTAGKSFVVDSQVGLDQCLFVRAVNYYDDREVPSIPVIPEGAIGVLKPPTIDSCVPVRESRTVTITATNTSEVPDSELLIYCKIGDGEPLIIGNLPHAGGEAILKTPEWGDSTPEFGVFAFVGEYSETEDEDNVLNYSIDSTQMLSSTIWDGGYVPNAPTTFSAVPRIVNGVGTISCSWDLNWTEADGAQLSWSEHSDAWGSTDEPDTYDVSKANGSNWNISGLETGQDWFVRVRFYKGSEEGRVYGPWSDMITVPLKSQPTIPALMLSEDNITEDGSFTASWAYSSADNQPQAMAELCLATRDDQGVLSYGEPFISVASQQFVNLTPAAFGGVSGETYLLCVRVTSTAGEKSEGWSAPAPITIAELPTISIDSTTFEERTITIDAEEQLTETVNALVELPFTAIVTGAGEGGTTRITFERAEDYHVDRPDETDFNGFEGEVVALAEMVGEGEMSITGETLIGHLDDGARYKMIAEVIDSLGQSIESEIDFMVIWDHQALKPGATVTMDYERNAAIITPIAPSGAAETDRVDIYRLSADKPELIYPDAEFGTTYVDPYPAIGEHGGHRIVTRTANGDYITTAEDGGETPAWLDLRAEEGDFIETIYGIIDFDGRSVPLMYDVDVDNDFEKEFRETKYLGGAIRGDWNAGVSRTGTITTNLINLLDEDQVEDWRRLARHEGICHIRTVDGSSFNANIQVKENRPSGNRGVYTEFSLSFTKVDPEDYDGLTYQEWSEAEE